MELDRVFNHQVTCCLQLLRQLSQEYNYIILLTNLTMTRNEVGLREWEAQAIYSEITDRDWPAFMDSRFMINKSDALKSENAYFDLKLKILKSRHLKSGRTCIIPVTDRGIELQ